MKHLFTPIISRLCTIGLAAACFMASPSAVAATITYNGVNYTTSKTNATVAKSSTKTGDYTGEMVIPETFEYSGVTYTVVGVAANAFKESTVTKVTLPKTAVSIGRNAFIDCHELTNYPVPETATSLGNGAFKNCVKITEAFIPAGVTTPIISEQFSGCTSLRKLEIKASDVALKLHNGMLGQKAADYPPLEEIFLGRNIDFANYQSNQNPFRGLPLLQKVTIGKEVTEMIAEAFASCPKLANVAFEQGGKLAAIGSQAFANCPQLATIALPNEITTVGASAFAGCTALSSVALNPEVATIESFAFSGCTALKSIALPEALTTISASAFAGSGLAGDLVIPAKVAAIGSSAFAGTALTSVSIPASVATIGVAAFAPITTLASIQLDAANAAFALSDGVLTTADGKRLLVVAHQSPSLATSLSNATVTTVDDYGLAFTPFATVELPALQSLGNSAFHAAKISSFTLASGVSLGTGVFGNSALQSITVQEGRNEIPQGMCANCAQLKQVTLPSTTTNIMRDAFANCSALESMEIPSNCNYMEQGAVPASVKSLRVLNVNAPVLAAGVFTAEQGDVECKVAATSVDKFKKAAQWQFLNVVADATIAGTGAALGCPTGLYFATKDGRLMYKDEAGKLVDTKFATGDHAFSLASYKNRIYVGVAGTQFRYQSPTAGAGDGELFYVNRTGDIFYRVTVLNNVGYEAFQDPFSMTIIPSDDKIYIADRNVGIHEMSADTVGLYGEQPFFVQNNWLPYYGDQISYGAIGAGLAKDEAGVYWMAKKFNGLGIFRFTKSDIYPDGGAGRKQPFKVVLKDVQMTTFYLDEAHGYLYFYLQKAPGDYKPGMYRMAIADIKAADAAQAEVGMDKAVLLDDAPVLLEGSGDEITGVTQISGDENNVYWAYIATTADDKSVPGSVALDEQNPLHHSGIKYVAASGESNEVKFAVDGVEAYGVVPATFVPDSPSGVETVNADAKAQVSGSKLTVPAAARVSVYAIGGALLSSHTVAAGATVSLQGYSAGIYVVTVAYQNGATETLKIIR